MGCDFHKSSIQQTMQDIEEKRARDWPRLHANDYLRMTFPSDTNSDGACDSVYSGCHVYGKVLYTDGEGGVLVREYDVVDGKLQTTVAWRTWRKRPRYEVVSSEAMAKWITYKLKQQKNACEKTKKWVDDGMLLR